MADVTPERIAEIKMRRDAATPGPWEATLDDHGRDGIEVGVWAHSEYIAELITSDRATADAVFIAHARTDVDDLLAEVERLTAVIEKLTAAINRADAQGVHVMTTASIRAHLQAPDGGETP